MRLHCAQHRAAEPRVDIINGILPGGGGITDAAHSQLSALQFDDERLQESSRGSTTDAVVHYNIKKMKLARVAFLPQ